MMKYRSTLALGSLLLLAACNAFQQKVNIGPGTEKMEDHTLEIVLMLGVAFLMGLWLGWLLWSRYKQTADTLAIENDSLRLADLAYRTDTDALRTKLTAAETEAAAASQRAENVGRERDDLVQRVAALSDEALRLSEHNNRLEMELGIASAQEAPAADVPLELVENQDDAFDVLAEKAVPAPMISLDFVRAGRPETEEFLPENNAPDAPEDLPEMADEPATTTEIFPENDAPDAPEDLPEMPDEPTATTEIFPENDAPDAPEDLPEMADEPTTTTEISPENDAPETLQMVADELVAPVPADEPFVSESAPENAAPMAELFVASVADGLREDLKIVEGIGPKIEELLFEHGVFTYQQLAATPVARIREILENAGPAFAMHEPGTWPAQALLAANGEWENMRAYQEYLSAGKRPG